MRINAHDDGSKVITLPPYHRVGKRYFFLFSSPDVELFLPPPSVAFFQFFSFFFPCRAQRKITDRNEIRLVNVSSSSSDRLLHRAPRRVLSNNIVVINSTGYVNYRGYYIIIIVLLCMKRSYSSDLLTRRRYTYFT